VCKPLHIPDISVSHFMYWATWPQNCREIDDTSVANITLSGQCHPGWINNLIAWNGGTFLQRTPFFLKSNIQWVRNKYNILRCKAVSTSIFLPKLFRCHLIFDAKIINYRPFTQDFFISKSFPQVSQTDSLTGICFYVSESEIPDMIDFPAPNPVLNPSLFIPSCHNGRWWMYEFDTVTITLWTPMWCSLCCHCVTFD